MIAQTLDLRENDERCHGVVRQGELMRLQSIVLLQKRSTPDPVIPNDYGDVGRA
jgi:hypothetical protein